MLENMLEREVKSDSDSDFFLQKLDYRWVETASIDVGCHIKVISWNISATRLLVATEENLELWNYLPKEESSKGNLLFFALFFPQMINFRSNI